MQFSHLYLYSRKHNTGKDFLFLQAYFPFRQPADHSLSGDELHQKSPEAPPFYSLLPASSFVSTQSLFPASHEQQHFFCKYKLVLLYHLLIMQYNNNIFSLFHTPSGFVDNPHMKGYTFIIRNKGMEGIEMRILLINGSPKGKRSNSLKLAYSFIKGLENRMYE